MLNLRKKLLVSIFTLMLALVAVSTTTYAWFTMGAEAKVSNIDLTVQGVEGLKVRVTKINGVDTKNVTSLGSHTNNLIFDDGYLSEIKLEPMTLAASAIADAGTNFDDLYKSKYDFKNQELSFEKIAAYASKVNADGTVKPSGNYLEIEFEFLAESSENTKDVIIQSVDFTIPANFNFNSDANFKLYDDELSTSKVVVGQALKDVRLVNALRFAYAPQTMTEGTSETPDTFAEPTGFKVINPNDLAVSENATNYGNWGVASVNYFNAVNNLKDASAIKATTEYKSAYVDLDDAVVVTLVESGFYTGLVGRATVRVWLEGWDSDCFNAIIQDTVEISITYNIE